MIPIYIGTLIVILWGIGCLWQRNNEKRWWNGGYCRDCGSEWKRFDMDSQGGRGYSCECGKSIWISYRVDKKERCN